MTTYKAVMRPAMEYACCCLPSPMTLANGGGGSPIIQIVVHQPATLSSDGCDLASTLCKYDLRKGDLFVLSWARVRRVRRESISSELLTCGGGVHSIMLLPLVARCLETIDVCLFFMSIVVTVWGSMGMLVV